MTSPIQVKFPPAETEKFDELKKFLGVSDDYELLVNVFSLMQEVKDVLEKGGVIVAYGPDHSQQVIDPRKIK